eukprot:gene3282-5724_t
MRIELTCSTQDAQKLSGLTSWNEIEWKNLNSTDFIYFGSVTNTNSIPTNVLPIPLYQQILALWSNSKNKPPPLQKKIIEMVFEECSKSFFNSKLLDEIKRDLFYHFHLIQIWKTLNMLLCFLDLN